MKSKSPKSSNRKQSMFNNDLFRFNFPLIKGKDNERKMSFSIYKKRKNKVTKKDSLSFYNENISNKIKNIYNIASNKNNNYSLRKKSISLNKDHNLLFKRKKSCVISQSKNFFEKYSLDSSIFNNSNMNCSFMLIEKNLKKEINKMKNKINQKQKKNK